MTAAMVPIYKHLITDTNERGDWPHWLEREREDTG